MNEYSEMEVKIALCLQSGMMAKETAVKEYGVGEDLTFSLFAWKDDAICAIATMGYEYMREDPAKRLERISIAATILRKGWHVDEFTFLAEAFCSMDAARTKGKNLREAFLEPDSPVQECLTLTHITHDSAVLLTQPYSVGLGRKVEWHPLLRNLDTHGLRDSQYPFVLMKVLELEVEPIPENKTTFHRVLADGLESDGFAVQWTFE